MVNDGTGEMAVTNAEINGLIGINVIVYGKLLVARAVDLYHNPVLSMREIRPVLLFSNTSYFLFVFIAAILCSCVVLVYQRVPPFKRFIDGTSTKLHQVLRRPKKA